MIRIPIFFYSKYCKECPKILSVIDPNRFLFICIDNPDVRKKIVDDNKFKIQTVPCILYFEKDTSFEKYEGENVIKWLSVNNMWGVSPPTEEPSSQDFEEESITEESSPPPPPQDEVDENVETDPTPSDMPISTKNSVLTLAQQMQRERESQPVVSKQ